MNKPVYGTVGTGRRYCIVYSRPSIMSDAVIRLRPGDLVEIDEDNSTSCYYKVKTETNDEGYILVCDVDRKEG